MPKWVKWFIAGGIITILGVIDYFSKWGVFAFLWDIIKIIPITAWFGTAFLIIILILYFKVYRINKYLAISFKDDFKKNPKDNWDFNGKWELVPGGGEINITDSEIGGITRVGHLWRDYCFEFTATIVNDRIGWIIRAQDPFNYYMIQLK